MEYDQEDSTSSTYQSQMVHEIQSKYFPSDNLFPNEYFGSVHVDSDSYQPQGPNRYSEWKNGTSPYNVSLFQEMKSDNLARSRREHIKDAMKFVWNNYRKYAFGADELKPKSGEKDECWGGIGVTLVDALDTLILMGMDDEFKEATEWVSKNLDFDKNETVSLFETTIRSLGGLLSAYDWSKDAIFLEKAKDLGDRLVKAFDTAYVDGFPFNYINLRTGMTSPASWMKNKLLLAEVGTLALEFRDLSKHTGNETYAKKSQHIFEVLKEIQPDSGLFPKFLTSKDKHVQISGKEVSFGAMGDSFYEYELKVWLQGMRKEKMYRDMYDKSIQGLHDEKLKVSSNGLTYIFLDQKTQEMDHLSCFMGGLLALGAFTDPQGFESNRAQRDLKTSKALAYTCYQMYATMETGLSPEIMKFPLGIKGIQELRPISASDSYYLLRPETIETFFILTRVTGDPIYREWGKCCDCVMIFSFVCYSILTLLTKSLFCSGWEIFQNIEKYSKTKYGYGTVKNVQDKKKSFIDDKMESFFLGETLKYFYLLFDPESKVDLDKYVFNTEAHPLRIE